MQFTQNTYCVLIAVIILLLLSYERTDSDYLRFPSSKGEKADMDKSEEEKNSNGEGQGTEENPFKQMKQVYDVQ